MDTFFMKSKDIKRDWYVIDAAGKPLGRVASKAAFVLMGKNKPTYTPHLDDGDCVVILNAESVVLTGRKSKVKNYYNYSGYPGGLKTTSFKDMMIKKPTVPLERAIKGMLPKNRLARQMIKKLYVFQGAEHNVRSVTLKPLEI